MTNKCILSVFFPLFLVFLIISGPVLALDPGDIVKLTKAGLNGKVIQTIIDEKAIETCAFTVEEIIDLKKSGLSNDAIEGIVKKGSFMKGPKTITYGDSTKSLRSVSPEDMIKLKNAGISDDVLKEIARGSINRDDEEHRRAWNMLNNMGLLVDGRRDLIR